MEFWEILEHLLSENKTEEEYDQWPLWSQVFTISGAVIY